MVPGEIRMNRQRYAGRLLRTRRRSQHLFLARLIGLAGPPAQRDFPDIPRLYPGLADADRYLLDHRFRQFLNALARDFRRMRRLHVPSCASHDIDSGRA